ncbi:hypothetical protein GALMADRAFT_46831, partial [Galerina marginata CBS 339.88]
VYRQSWLRARAQKDRWAEELELCKYEMSWTARFYAAMAQQWRRRGNAAVIQSPGHRVYAEEQIAMWNEL